MIHFYHGLIGDSRHFAQVAATCAARGLPTRNPDIPFLELDYAAIVPQHTGHAPSPAVRVGNSIGCGLALATAGPADRLILTAPPFDYSRGSVALSKAHVRDWVSALYVRKGEIPDEAAIFAFAEEQLLGLMQSRARIRRLRHHKRAAQSFWQDPGLHAHASRMTFVIGQADFTTPVDRFVKHVKDHLPKARVVVWETCGHAVPLDAPQRLLDLILDEVDHVMTANTINAMSV